MGAIALAALILSMVATGSSEGECTEYRQVMMPMRVNQATVMVPQKVCAKRKGRW